MRRLKPPLEGVNHAYEVRRNLDHTWRVVAVEDDGRETPILDLFGASGNAEGVALSLNEAYSRGVDDGLALAAKRAEAAPSETAK